MLSARILRFAVLVVGILSILDTALAASARTVGRLLELAAVGLTTSYSYRCAHWNRITGEAKDLRDELVQLTRLQHCAHQCVFFFYSNHLGPRNSMNYIGNNIKRSL